MTVEYCADQCAGSIQPAKEFHLDTMVHPCKIGRRRRSAKGIDLRRPDTPDISTRITVNSRVCRPKNINGATQINDASFVFMTTAAYAIRIANTMNAIFTRRAARTTTIAKLSLACSLERRIDKEVRHGRNLPFCDFSTWPHCFEG
jgi:hypothetical protein